jgi:hypothetical protein
MSIQKVTSAMLPNGKTLVVASVTANKTARYGENITGVSRLLNLVFFSKAKCRMTQSWVWAYYEIEILR